MLCTVFVRMYSDTRDFATVALAVFRVHVCSIRPCVGINAIHSEHVILQRKRTIQTQRLLPMQLRLGLDSKKITMILVTLPTPCPQMHIVPDYSCIGASTNCSEPTPIYTRIRQVNQKSSTDEEKKKKCVQLSTLTADNGSAILVDSNI